MAATTSPKLAKLQPVPDHDDSAVITSPVDATPTSAGRPVSASGAASTTRHRRRASEINPTSPAARRMSMSKTPQVMRGRVEGGVEGVVRRVGEVVKAAARRPLVGMALLLAAIVVSATAYSSAHSMALNTSLCPSPSRTAYFAQKTNIFNQYFVKLAWLHTSLIYLPHLFTSHATSYLPHLASYALSTSFWAIFTTWFFGRGLGDRIIELSGGKCVIALPAEWRLQRETLEEMMTIIPASVGASLLSSTLDSTTSSLADTANVAPPEDNLYLAVPSSLCTSHAALTPKSHPDIFAILRALPFPQSVYSESERPILSLPKPRWYRGHDISGHVFILVLSTLLLTRRLVPTWRRWLGASDAVARASEPKSDGERTKRRVHAVLTIAGTALVGLWVWMTAMTSIYFHNPQEKMSGLVLGITTAFLVDTFTPALRSSSIPIRATKPEASARVTLPPTLDENGARRGEMEEAETGVAAGSEGGSARPKVE